MEIFSVFVDRENDDILDLSGTIKVAYSVGECTIFKRELNKPQELSPCSKTIATTGHYECFLGTELGIIASYSNYSYSTESESKYYRAVLLDKHKDDVLELRGSSEIPLTRYVVAVPFQSFLMIEVNLNACSILSVDDDALDGYPNSRAYRSLQTTAALKANFSGKSSFSFEGDSYGICISVEWGRRYIT